MKRGFIFTGMLVLSYIAFGQQIKNRNIELDDLMTLLNVSGYELFCFDIADMLNERYDIVFVTKEYAAGQEIASTNIRAEQINPEDSVEKISFGFLPANNDSTRVMRISVPGIGTFAAPEFKLKGLSMIGLDRKVYRYRTRSFKLGEIKNGEFAPLILFASGWYDEISNVLRFCGEREIDPDMSSEILKDVPHHYVIGVEFIKK